jgi:hypothetical protein
MVMLQLTLPMLRLHALSIVFVVRAQVSQVPGQAGQEANVRPSLVPCCNAPSALLRCDSPVFTVLCSLGRAFFIQALQHLLEQVR